MNFPVTNQAWLAILRYVTLSCDNIGLTILDEMAFGDKKCFCCTADFASMGSEQRSKKSEAPISMYFVLFDLYKNQINALKLKLFGGLKYENKQMII